MAFLALCGSIRCHVVVLVDKEARKVYGFDEAGLGSDGGVGLVGDQIIGETHGSSDFGIFLEQIWALKNSFSDVFLGSCLKRCNRVDKMLTDAAMDNLGDSLWLDKIPDCIISLIECSIGRTYTFSIYSSTLKSSQNYDQSSLERVAVFKDIGGCTGILSGLLYSYVTLDRHRRNAGCLRCFCGPWVVLLKGAILSFVGYFFMSASVVGVIHRPPLALMCLFVFTAAHSQTFSIPADNVTGVKNFPAHVGTIVGILEGSMGLSGAILIQVYDALFEGNPSNYLLFLAVFPASVSLLLMYFVRFHDTNSGDDKKHLNVFSVVALTMVAYLMILIILQNIFTLTSTERVITFIFLLLLLASPLGIAFKAKREDAERLISSQTFPNDERISLVYNPEPIASKAYHDQLPGDHEACQIVNTTLYENIIQIEENMNLQQVICTGNFWLLFIAMICGLGSGTATINNISQVGASLGYTSIEKNSLVSLLSIWNFLGRFGAGYVSDIFLQRRGYPRPLFMAITQAALSVGLIVIASGFPYNLWFSFVFNVADPTVSFLVSKTVDEHNE
ncbi:hypothetical protein Ddye_002492 [Dipteronia dyeriana]|uniref:Nodulin-like domain-containing protein n=1 Tax=Dipteronia dyeriana TaxID=168575 RepID=A0AAD9XR67_9ROSI|nr:hypothetical protein Ddye_002492 [Dipteronia dyeriana]